MLPSSAQKEYAGGARSSPREPAWGFIVTERLWQIYEQLCQVEMLGLDEFVRRLRNKEFGEFPRGDVVALLREIEANMLNNIQTKALEHQRYADMADQVSEETHLMFDELIEDIERS